MSLLSQIGNQPDRETRFSNTISFDAPNAFRGGSLLPNGERRNGKSWAFKGGAFINTDYKEFGLYLNLFPTIDFYAIGASFHKEFATINLSKRADRESTISVLMGGNIELAVRYGLPLEGTKQDGLYNEGGYNPEHINYSISTKIRWDKPFNLPGYLEAEGLYTRRSDIRDRWGEDSKYKMFDNPSLYITFGFYFIEIIEYLNDH